VGVGAKGGGKGGEMTQTIYAHMNKIKIKKKKIKLTNICHLHGHQAETLQFCLGFIFLRIFTLLPIFKEL
jgi:hypothetical protein